MNAYKEKLRTRINLISFAAAAAALVYVVLTIYREQLPVLPSFIKGFHIGAFIGFELFAVWYLVRCMKARKNEAEMKKMFIEENDERTGLIIRNASTLGISVVLIGLAVAAIISGFFSATVFFSLMGSLLFVLIVFYALWVYYASKL
ncbi:hypothetical protein M3223_10520 [Paenibacillus pasadenensis]|uniref:hypothetical protein n=1 Tax=Paenibacillus pasadenensis TaxID=217090 RepID=UPI0020401876|nr:hypothetical protein [Paenibacillus pasadenensis]MCM3747791.1 hypothetical protein [Paenibacillus pasadenensis]